MDSTLIITAFVALFVVIDPIGLAPIFVALTQGMGPARRRALAIRACVIAFGILLIFGILGEAVLNFLGISMPAFRIAGGILLFLTALEMLFEMRTKRRNDRTDQGPDPSVFPLAIPLIAGPGAIATMILLAGQAGDDYVLRLIYLGVMGGVVILVCTFFLMSNMIERLLGQTGVVVVTRLLGMLLAALSVQFVLDGIKGLM